MPDNKGIKQLWGYDLIDSKARNAISSTRSSLENDFQKKTDDTLGTTSKTIPGAINEIKDSVDNLDGKFSVEQTDTKYDMKYNGKTIANIGLTLTDDQIAGGDGSFNIDLSPYQTKTDTSLTTNDKTISGAIKELNTQYKDIANNKADKNDLQAQKARINSFTSLKEGSTTGDAELIDGRTGVDGTIYTNIGDAIRTQLSNIKTGIETLSSVTNIISIDKLSNELAEGLGKYIDKYNLVLNTNSYRGACYIKEGKLTSYTADADNNRFTIVDVVPGQKLKISLRAHNTTNYHIILADKDNNVVANYFNDADKVYTDYELTIPKEVVKLGVNSYSYLPTILSYEVYSPIANRDYVDTQKITFDRLSDELANGLAGYNEITNLEFNRGACYIKAGKLTSYTADADHNRWVILNVATGQKLKISLRSHNTTNYHIILADGNDNVIANYINDEDKVYTDYELTIPKNAVKLGVNSYSYNATIKSYGMVSPIATQQFVLDTVFKEGLEDYYNTDGYLDNKILEIKNNTKVASGVSFAFITDTHMKSNRLQSKYLLKEILDNTSIPFVVNGGDIVRAYGTKADIQEDVDKWYKYVKYLNGKMFNVHGNHDFTISSEDKTTGFTYDKWYNYDYIMREQETNAVCENGKLYYYFDNPAQRVRFIVLDSVEYINAGDNPWGARIGISQEQYEWFIDALSNIGNYNFVVFSHQAANPNLKSASGIGPVQGILEALNNKATYSYNENRLNISVDFSTTTNICCCHICGHGHCDDSNKTNNVVSIETTCDAYYWDDGYKAAQGTITEQAFDVFTIDTSNRTIKAVRIGRGNNREWTY